MKQLAILLMVIAAGLQSATAETVPNELVGEWAVAETRFRDGWPSIGNAFYVRRDGAIVACGVAVGHNNPISRYRSRYNERTKLLTGYQYYLGDEKVLWTMSFDPASKTLTSHTPVKGVSYSKIGTRIPPYFRAAL